MAKKKKQHEEHKRMTMLNREHEALSASGMESHSAERVGGAGTHGDARAGDEGVDDPETMRGGERTNENMARKRTNDERFDDASDFGGQGAQRGHDMEKAEGTGYRGRERSNTDDNSEANPLS